MASANLAVHAGLLVLPLAVVAVVNRGPADAHDALHRVARFEPHQAAQWREVARSQDDVLPDARPVQVDLDGRVDGGHIAVLPSQDGQRLRVPDPAADWAELFSVTLPGRVTMTAALEDGSGVAALLADGQIVLAGA